MSKVLMEITMSLDGYTTGPEVSAEAPFGRGGDRLHEWMFAGESAADSDRRETDHFSTIGALIMGRRMADLGIGPWGEEPTFHAPCFIVTHRPAETIVKKGGTSYIFVTEGIEAAMAQAQAAAGEQDVVVQGAYTAQQPLEAGVLDELLICHVPVLFGAGRRLFDVLPSRIESEIVGVIDTPEATHIRYRVRRQGVAA